MSSMGFVKKADDNCEKRRYFYVGSESIKIQKYNNQFEFNGFDPHTISTEIKKIVFQTSEDDMCCHLCNMRLDKKYIYIINSLEKAGLLMESEKKLCCFCWNAIYNEKSIVGVYLPRCDLCLRYQILISGMTSCLVNVKRLNLLIKQKDKLAKLFLKNIERYLEKTR